ncbi:alcohol dehydrogenase Zn-binding [Gluconobacter frateurii M-2]|nr:alcohol dehydrogenase Zn-binding [Gluconobacter frateurii M-2]
MAQALVFERKGELSLRQIALPSELGPNDVRIAIHTAGICGIDVRYYMHGAIGPFVVREPMVLGHEASGTITEVGSHVRYLKVGDRVCREPGIPDPQSRATLMVRYTVDPAVRFWATPPIHGCISARKIDLKPLVSETFPFDQGIASFERAAEARPSNVKLQIVL